MNLNALDRMGRRRFIKIASSVGVGISSLQFGSQKALAKRTDDEQVGYVDRMRVTKEPSGGNPPEREPIYDTIERDRWNVIYTGKNAVLKIKKEIDSWQEQTRNVDPWLSAKSHFASGIGVSVHLTTYKNSSGEIKSSSGMSKGEVERRLPSSIMGEAGEDEYRVEREVDIEVNETTVKRMDLGTDQMGEEYWDNGVPGGVEIRTGSTCSSCGTFFRRNSSGQAHGGDADQVGLITAAHCFNADEMPGRDVNQREDETLQLHKIGVGTERFLDGDTDCAFVDIGEEGCASQIAKVENEEDGVSDPYDFPIEGIITNESLEKNIDEKVLDSQGQKTGRTAGLILEVKPQPSIESVVTGADQSGGDSGGACFFVNDNNEAFIAGVASGQTNHGNDEDLDNCRDDTRYTTAERTENILEGSFF